MRDPLPFDAVEVDRFVQRLRGTFDEVYPDRWSIDWSAIPSPFRWYESPVRIDLPPLPRAAALGDAVTTSGRTGGRLNQLGAILQASYGVSGVRWYPEGIAKSSPDEPKPVHREPHYQLRRPVPSGGVTFPVECYVLSGSTADLPAGRYHYDATRHALVPLSAPNDPYEGSRADMPAVRHSGIRLLLTAPLWKNYFKYSDFSYRLAALDSGTVVGQYALVAHRWGWGCRVSFDADERAVLAELGLDARQEAVIAVLDVDPPSAEPATTRRSQPGRVPTADLTAWRGAAGGPPPQAGASRMHAATLTADRGTGLPVDLPALPDPDPQDTRVSGSELITLPDVGAVDVPSVAESWSRTALGEQLRSTPLPSAAVARWLVQAAAPLNADLPGAETGLDHVRCVLLIRAVEGLRPGAYLSTAHGRSLMRLAEGEFGAVVGAAMFGQYMNLVQAPLVVALVGAADPQLGRNGALAYRVQHHVAGVIAQRLLVAAASDGVTGHPVLGFTSATLDRPTGVEALGWTSLLLMPFGLYRRALYLESSLNPLAVPSAAEVDR
ncbi:SagB-type dehydrogenase family enzyme [Actinoalloteichus hoggarensis]|uniref:Nitroreductase family protein n=1 Tax=Actinoalloteichus hoggarensis TaxID=1470176 RepID=A0A221W4N7_9PSEU|nr:SagB family peptide dehydrogenase [Actinoalloteichus hoggarensis]ASO20673.1 Nitroreductase family protein [Actinoalloteichus hoggarensis]MBB5924474.1 SagB-type dehydrogenase family enzyme [Actinoalloteichus hoggarensis]